MSFRSDIKEKLAAAVAARDTTERRFVEQAVVSSAASRAARAMEREAQDNSVRPTYQEATQHQDNAAIARAVTKRILVEQEDESVSQAFSKAHDEFEKLRHLHELRDYYQNEVVKLQKLEAAREAEAHLSQMFMHEGMVGASDYDLIRPEAGGNKFRKKGKKTKTKKKKHIKRRFIQKTKGKKKYKK